MEPSPSLASAVRAHDEKATGRGKDSHNTVCPQPTHWLFICGLISFNCLNESLGFRSCHPDWKRYLVVPLTSLGSTDVPSVPDSVQFSSYTFFRYVLFFATSMLSFLFWVFLFPSLYKNWRELETKLWSCRFCALQPS